MKCVTHHEQPPCSIQTQCNPTIFTVAMLRVKLRKGVRIRKHLGRLFKRNLMLVRVPLRFVGSHSNWYSYGSATIPFSDTPLKTSQRPKYRRPLHFPRILLGGPQVGNEKSDFLIRISHFLIRKSDFLIADETWHATTAKVRQSRHTCKPVAQCLTFSLAAASRRHRIPKSGWETRRR